MITHPLGRERVNAVTRDRFRRHCRPLPRLSGSAWAERYRVLSAEATHQHGQWRNELVPYLVGIMDAITDRRMQRVTVVAPSQSGKTELELNILGYFMHQEPSPILVVQPTVEMAQDFSKLRFATMIRDTPVLSGLVSAPRSRDSNNTILSKQYPGGQADIVGANSPAGLAARPKRLVLLDEVDRFPAEAGAEGDPFDIAYARTRSYRHARKIVAVSSPTLEPERDTRGTWSGSRIWREYQTATQEVYRVACPACGFRQTLEFERLRWDRADGTSGPVVRDSVGYQCVACEITIPASEKGRMLRTADWFATATSQDPVHRSFRVHGLVAAFAEWHELAQEFVGKHTDPVRLKTFVNTALGECWKDRDVENQRGKLLARAARYDGGTGDAPVRFQVPASAGVLVAGCDVQHDRVEIVVRAFGVGKESWLDERAVLHGDTSQPTFWPTVDAYLQKTWSHEGGARLGIRAAAVDSGDGAMSKRVYQFTAPRLFSGVYAIKGSSNPTATILPMKPTAVKPGKMWMIGVHAVMDVLYRRLAMDTPGPGFLHLNEYATEDYVMQLLSMRRKTDEKTRKRKWEATPGIRNEVADCETYAYAALEIAVPESTLADAVTAINAEGARLTAGTPEPEPVAAPPAAPAGSWLAGGRSSWMGRRR